MRTGEFVTFLIDLNILNIVNDYDYWSESELVKNLLTCGGTR